LKPEISDIRGKKVTVFGAGRSGLAVAELLHENGAMVFLSEQNLLNKDKELSVKKLPKTIESEFGGHTQRAFEADWIIISPGISISGPIVQKAIVNGLPVFGELEVASWFCRSPIIAVTGSNGKSTTTTLLGEIFHQSGRHCVVAGNIGQPFAREVKKVKQESIVVLEVSSFQLEAIQKFHPKISVFLNLTPDHLDRHESIEKYSEVKERIFKNQTLSDYLVYNGLDQRVSKSALKAKCKKVVFGLDTHEGWCGYVHQGNLLLRSGEKKEIKLISEEELKIRGEHNVSNVLAASLCSCIMGVQPEVIREVLGNFNGLPHRMEFVRKIENIVWINDSKATNVDSVWYALGSFLNPVILIAGGRDKDSNFQLLKSRIKEKVKEIILLGEAAEKMAEIFQGIRPVVIVSSLKDAVIMAQKKAEPGDVVLLSPACASFDMFENFEDRGNQYKKLVEQIS
jgi:UDP-N-acetylmuramoylalanine--D-glutamate ligase